MRVSWRNLGLIVLLAVLTGLGIAALIHDPTPSDSLDLRYVPLVTQTPIPRTVLQGDTLQPGGASASSALLMIQGMQDRRLVLWPLSGTQPPQEIDHHIGLKLLLPGPGKTNVLYSTDNTVMVLTVGDRRATVVGELPEHATLTTAQWSPDGTALAYVLETRDYRIAYYTRADGSQKAVPMLHVPHGLPLDVAWLPDGRPVAIFMSVGPVGGLEARYQLYDPDTEDAIILPPDTPSIQPWSPWRSPDGKQQIYAMANWTKSRAGGACLEGALGLADADWLYLTSVGGRGKPRAVAFSVDNLFLYWPTWLSDGRILFWGAADDACLPGGSGLYIARLGEDPFQLIRTNPVYQTDDTDDLLWSAPYTPSPDQKWVAWVENDVTTQRSSVYLSPLDGGERVLLYQTPILSPSETEPFAFQDSQMILDLFWLP